ncbi:MAG: outer membrane beta-barrel protein [Acetobacteraceae bacterium]|nr:outer membrane beta-barrel protein [Acetobacteraceae bacterium]
MAVVVAAAGRPSQALAQVIDQYLPGFVAALSPDTPLTQLQPGFERPGIQLGDFTIRPLLSESLGYDTNPQQVKGGKGSAEFATTGSVSAASGWERNSLDAAISFNSVQYPEQSSQNATDWQTAIGGSYDIGTDVLSGAFTHLALTQRPNQIGSGTNTQIINYSVNDLRLNYALNPGGRISIVPGLDFQSYQFGSGFVNGFPANQQDRNVVQGEVVGRYEFSPLRDAVVVVRGIRVGYPNESAAEVNGNSFTYEVLAGLDYAATGVFRFRALGGYEHRSYASSAIPDQSVGVIEASALWSPTPSTTATITARNDIEDPVDGNLVGFTYRALRLSVDHEMAGRALLGVFGEVQRAIQPSSSATLKQLGPFFSEEGGNQTVYQAGANVSVPMNRILWLGANVFGGHFEPAGGGSFTKGTFLVSLSVGL